MKDKKFKGWDLSLDNDGENNRFYLNKGDQSASLEFAIETGCDSSCDEKIPERVIYWACCEADKVDPSGEWLEEYSNYDRA